MVNRLMDKWTSKVTDSKSKGLDQMQKLVKEQIAQQSLVMSRLKTSVEAKDVYLNGERFSVNLDCLPAPNCESRENEEVTKVAPYPVESCIFSNDANDKFLAAWEETIANNAEIKVQQEYAKHLAKKVHGEWDLELPKDMEKAKELSKPERVKPEGK